MYCNHVLSSLFRLILLVCCPLLTKGLCALELSNSSKAPLKMGVICALPKELGALVDEMESPFCSETVGNRQYNHGKLWEIDTILVISRVGKVAAATTATHLIQSGKVDGIIYVGVAGAIDLNLSQGDIVIGEKLLQYDMDSRPLAPQFTIPLLNVSTFEADTTFVEMSR